MKKIPTLFVREFENHRVIKVTEKVTPGLEWVLDGDGIATLKFDGSCTAIIDGVFYKRYDAKKVKKAPEGAIPCCKPDPITGHHPHWVRVDENNPGDKWFVEAYKNAEDKTDGTYEAIGPHFHGNPYGCEFDTLVKHGRVTLEVPRTFEGIRKFLAENDVEGIVFWKDGEPQCKIKRSDFGYKWKE